MDEMIKYSLALLVLSACLISPARANQFDYSGYKVFRCLPETNEQLQEMRRLESTMAGSIDFWTPAYRLNSSVDIMVGPEKVKLLGEWLEDRQVLHKILISDVGHQMQSISPPKSLVKLLGNTTLRADILSAENYFTQYQRYKTIEAKIKSLSELDNRVKLETIGKSFEGRDLYLVKVSSDHGAGKPVILLDAGHHAREWISHSTIIYLLESLVNIDLPRLSKKACLSESCINAAQEKVKLDLENFDYWFVPVINPDGYEYSHTTDRNWRKTRSRAGTGLYNMCRGVDPNRNYDFHWSESGSSPYACSDIYAGKKAFSEPETAALANVMLNNPNRIIMYLSLHAYSQLILTPYGHSAVYPKDYKHMEKVALAGISSLGQLRSTAYEFGPSSVVLYPAAGGSDDFAYGKANIKYAYTMELPDKGRYGFLLPPREIIPVGHEVLLSLRSMTDTIIEIERAQI